MMAKKGSGNSIDDIKAAIVEAGGDALRAAELLGVTRTSFYNYMHKNPELAALREEEKRKAKAHPDGLEDVVKEVDPHDAPVLTQKQLEAIEFIDKESNKGELWANVNSVRLTTLIKLQEMGFIKLRHEEGKKWAMLTDDGEIALIWHVIYGSREWELMQGYQRPERKGDAPKTDIKKFVKPFGADDGMPSADENEQLINEVIGRAAADAKPIGGGLYEVDVVLPGANGSDCPNCAECVHREVLEYLIEQDAEVQKLYDYIADIKSLEKQAKAILKKLGG